MSSLRLAALFLVVLVLAVPAEASTHGSGLRAPRGLHAFLLRSDEAPARTFSRTPAFAWKPVAGARKYEFALSTSPLFAASGLVWDDPTLTSPAAAVPVLLPWITGSPHSLYARVRAISAGGRAGAWSASFGFDMRWSNGPEPLSAPAGLVRWTPLEGATSYQVWYGNIDTGAGKSKIFSTTTNVADEREYYAFHQTTDYM